MHPRHLSIWLLTTSAAAPHVVPALPARAGASLTAIAVRSDPLPGGAGIFISFDTTAMQVNDNQTVAFYANISGAPAGANNGFFKWTQASGRTEIVLKNAMAPDGNGQFNALSRPSMQLNELDEIAFHSTFFNTVGGFADDAGILFHDGSALAFLVREADPAPEGTYAAFTDRTVKLNDSSQVVFQCNLNGTDGGNEDASAVVLKSGMTEQIIAQRTLPAPDGIGVYNSFNSNSIRLNNQGQVLLFSTFMGAGVNVTNDTGYIRTAPPVMVLREGDALGGGTLSGTDPNSPQLNHNSDIAIEVSLAGVPADVNAGVIVNGFFAGREGDPAPDGVGTLNGVNSDPRLNSGGRVAYLSRTDGSQMGGDDDEIILRASGGGALTHIVRENDLAPDGIAIIDTFFGTSIRINDLGQVAFFVQLNDAGNIIDAILLHDERLGLIELVREGDVLAGSTIQTIGSTGIELNNLGQVLFTGTLVLGNREFLAITDVLNPPGVCPGDANGDNTVDINDLNQVVGNFGATGAPGIPGDVNNDGSVDINDINQVLGNFGLNCL